jgi:hypothetical protein
MKKSGIILFLSIISVLCVNCQEQAHSPWGIWNIDTVDFKGPYVRGTVETGKYYIVGSNTDWIWILQSGAYDYPVFAVDGSADRIEKYEKTAEGFLFHLIGNGVRYNPMTGRPEFFQNNTRIKIKMTLISQDECVFDFPDGFYYQNDRFRTGADKDGFVLQNVPRTDTVYRRYPVKDGAEK